MSVRGGGQNVPPSQTGRVTLNTQMWLLNAYYVPTHMANKSLFDLVRQSKNQKEYINRKGIHVVVGHYQGDPPAENLTQGQSNSPPKFRVVCLQSLSRCFVDADVLQ